MKKTYLLLVSALVASITMPSVYAAWTVEEYNQNSCSHKITDGNWEIGVYKYDDTKWSFGKALGNNGSSYIAGSGVLDLRTLEADCGVVLKVSNNGAFEYTSGLTEVYFPDSMESFTGNTFKQCKALTKVVFGSGMKSIGYEAFSSCSALKTVSFPEGLEEIQRTAFDWCSAMELDGADLPQSIKAIGNCAFRGCSKITGDVYLPNFTDPLNGGYQFESTSIRSFSAPSLTVAPEGILYQCKSLVSASFSPNLTSIGYRSFQNTPNLKDFYPTTFIPQFSSIGTEAFRGCGNLEVDFDFSKTCIETLPRYALVDLKKVTSIKFPKTLTTLNSECLAYSGSNGRQLWFMGPPPSTIDYRALYPQSTVWVIIAGYENASAWEASENLIALEEGDAEKAIEAARAQGIESGVKPIGKWTHEAGGYTHWVLKEFPPVTLISIQ